MKGWMELALRAVEALERIADALERPADQIESAVHHEHQEGRDAAA